MDSFAATIELGPYAESDVEVRFGTKTHRPTDGVVRFRAYDVDFRRVKGVFAELDSTGMHLPEQIRAHNVSHVHRARASSTRAAVDASCYGPEHAVDGRLDTAWCEGTDGHGEGEWLQISVRTPYRPRHPKPICGIAGIALVPGDARSDESWTSHGRITEIEVEDCQGEQDPLRVAVEPVDGAGRRGFELLAVSGAPEGTHEWVNGLTQGLPRDPGGPVQVCARIRITGVRPGSGPAHTCISEASVVVNCY